MHKNDTEDEIHIPKEISEIVTLLEKYKKLIKEQIPIILEINKY